MAIFGCASVLVFYNYAVGRPFSRHSWAVHSPAIRGPSIFPPFGSVVINKKNRVIAMATEKCYPVARPSTIQLKLFILRRKAINSNFFCELGHTSHTGPSMPSYAGPALVAAGRAFDGRCRWPVKLVSVRYGHQACRRKAQLQYIRMCSKNETATSARHHSITSLTERLL